MLGFMAREESASFLKKRSKNFCDLGHGRCNARGPNKAKVFCALFFKKALLSYFFPSFHQPNPGFVSIITSSVSICIRGLEPEQFLETIPAAKIVNAGAR
jgi:hypothetical protein